jgi:hypothetical protein
VIAKVSAPGTGLMIVGLLGFVPILLAVLAVPTWSLRSKPMLHESLESIDGTIYQPTSPSGLIPLVAAPVPRGTLAVGSPLATLPILVAQTDVRPLWAISTLGILVLAMLFNLAFSLVLLIGGWRMRQARSYGLSVIAAVLAILPCTFGWVLGLPIGIWALVVLMDPEVKAGFEG